MPGHSLITPEGTRPCRCCGQMLPVDCFYTAPRLGRIYRRSRCKECERKQREALRAGKPRRERSPILLPDGRRIGIFDGKKLCLRCNQVLPLEAYRPTAIGSKGTVRCYCRKCDCDRVMELRRKNPPSKEKVRAGNIKCKFGLNPEQFVALFHKQESQCPICEKALNFTEYGKRWVIDHDHKTGETRGILCNRCNTLLGHGADDENILMNAIKYLRSPPCSTNH